MASRPPVVQPSPPKKPESLAEFLAWAATENLDFTNAERFYATNIPSLRDQVQGHAFFKQLSDKLSSADDAYRQTTGSRLLLEGTASEFLTGAKPFPSVMDKAFRLNVLWNDKWPHPPRTGWIAPATWFSALDDVIRGTLVCKYIDGPAFLCTHLKKHADDCGVNSKHGSRELDDGYYAYHFYVAVPVTYTDHKWDAQTCDMTIEIQITTQFQELARSLTHEDYEATRSDPKRNRRDSSWKWDYASERFKRSYLSHTLHLLEGLVLELRSHGPAPSGALDDHRPAGAAYPYGFGPGRTGRTGRPLRAARGELSSRRSARRAAAGRVGAPSDRGAVRGAGRRERDRSGEARR